MSVLPRRLDPRGLLLLGATVAGWGLNWPTVKLLLGELPPFSMRVACGGIGIALVVGIALARGESLAVPRGAWPRLILAALLNVTAWMGFAAFALLWLSTAEATIACSTMPVWAGLFAWALLGERPSPRRVLALGLGLGGVAVLVAGPGVDLGWQKLPGVAVALAAAVLFALGAVSAKRWPLPLAPHPAVAWQLGLGMLPLLAGALAFEAPDFGALSGRGWALLLFGGLGPVGLCYVAWFGAVRRLPAGVAAAGTLLTPVIGVACAGLLLGEPIGAREALALAFTIAGVLLAILG